LGRRVWPQRCGNRVRIPRPGCTGVLCSLWSSLSSILVDIPRGKRGRTAKEVEGVVEPVFVGFRVNSFEPFGDIGGEVWSSLVVMFDVAKDEVI
jgi:hypothetical protein